MKNSEDLSEVDRMIGDVGAIFELILLHCSDVGLQVNLFLNDENKGNAEIDVMIGLKREWGKGFGKQAVLMMMKFGIQHLSVTRFFAKINSENTASLGLFKRCAIRFKLTLFCFNSSCCSLGFREVAFVAAFQEYELELIVDSPEGLNILTKAEFAVLKHYDPEE